MNNLNKHWSVNQSIARSNIITLTRLWISRWRAAAAPLDTLRERHWSRQQCGCSNMTPKCIMHCLKYVFLSYSLTISYYICTGDQTAPWWWLFSAYSVESLQDFFSFCLYMIFLPLIVHQHSSIQNVFFLTHHIIIHMVYSVEMIFLSMHFIFVLSSHQAEPCKAYSRFRDAQSHVLTSEIAKLLATEWPMFIASAH